MLWWRGFQHDFRMWVGLLVMNHNSPLYSGPQKDRKAVYFILFYFDRIVLFYLYSLFFLESQHEVPCVHLGKFYIKASIN